MTNYKQLCAKILAYYEGQGEYDFSHLGAIGKDNAAFDAWQELRAELKAALAETKRKYPSLIGDKLLVLAALNLCSQQIELQLSHKQELDRYQEQVSATVDVIERTLGQS